MNSKISIVLGLLFSLCFKVFGQLSKYQYKRELIDVTDDWHAIRLPDDLFKNSAPDLSDLRIYGVTKDNDTVEAPYVLRQNEEKRLDKNVVFKYVNKSTTQKGSYSTFKVTHEAIINQIELDYESDNFDRLIRVEGSQNLKDWHTVVNDFRVLSIKNKAINYAFTTVSFPDAKYAYFRVFTKGNNAPQIKKATITLQESEKAKYNTYAVKSIQTREKDKKTSINIDLKTAVPVSYIRIEDTNDYDFYRSIRIKYLRDSTKINKEWKYNYQNLAYGTLNSIEKNEFKFHSTVMNKIEVIIDNQDNEPIDIGAIVIKGYTHELITRFTKSAKYYLAYGNKNVGKPSYDLQYLTDKIPENPKLVQLGMEKAIERKGEKVITPLFENKIWLWIVMGVVILLLGGFTLSMMKKK